jgi:ABC-type sulfate transport system substrate-binding protein
VRALNVSIYFPSDWSEYFKTVKAVDLRQKFEGSSKAAIAMAAGLKAAGDEAVTKTLK